MNAPTSDQLSSSAPAPRRSGFARVVFLLAGVYGLPVMLLMLLFPAKFLEGGPAPRPEYYYGFVTVTLAFQVAFFVIAADPIRLRPMMPVAVCEKWFYVAAMIPLLLRHDVPGGMIAPVVIDALLGLLFLLAFLQTRVRPNPT